MEQKLSRWQIWPLNNFVEGPERNIHDIVLLQVWRQMEHEDKVRTVFYDGGVQDEEQWLEFIKHSSNLPVLVADSLNQIICCIAWLNGIGNEFAFAHFCFFNRFQRQAGRDVLAYWKTFTHPDGKPIFRALLGITTKSNDMALRAITILGWKTIGEIPGLCNLYYEDRRVPGVISYYDFGRGE